MKKLITITFAVLVALTLGLVPATPALAEIVGLWHFDETEGTTAHDDSGYANDGTVYDGTVPGATWEAAGSVGGALKFDGNDCVKILDSSTLDVAEAITLEAWVKPSVAAQGNARIIFKGTNSPFDPLYFLAYNASGTKMRMVVYINNIGKTATSTTSLIDINKWYHIAGTYDGTDVQVYIDGVLEGTTNATGDIDIGPGDIGIGRNAESTSYGYKGLIDEVIIYKGVLSDAVIAEHAQGIYDNQGPIASAVTADPNPIAMNTQTTVMFWADVDDTETGGSNIASAEYRVAEGDWQSMEAQNSPFDSINETVVAPSINLDLSTPGVHNVCVRGTDDFNNVGAEDCTLLVVYDPSGGFVTGGGWIISPAGAFPGIADLTGKATFGFVSKYQKGASVPTGNTEFQFKVADLNFKSTSYEWLVVAGARAQYKGSGTINGSGDYGFILTAIDGQISGGGGVDKFRIKIWNKDDDSIVYDNKNGASDTGDDTTELGGGSIVIHKK